MIDKIISHIHLTPEEKNQMKKNLMAFIEMNPFERKSLKVRPIWQRSLNPFKSMPAFLIALFVALSGGTAFAASSALPDQKLWSVKTSLNENIQAVFALTDEQKAVLRAKLAEKRLAEAEKLAVEGRLSVEALAKIEENFKTQEQRISNLIAKFVEKGQHDVAAELSSHLEATIATHKDILARLQAQAAASTQNNSDDQIDDLIDSVNDALKDATKNREDNEVRVKDDFKAQAAANVQAETARKIASVKEKIVKAEAAFGVAAVAEAKAKISQAETLFAQGKTKVEAGNFAEAFTIFHQAHRTAQSAKVLVEVRTKLNVDLREDNSGSGNSRDDDNERKFDIGERSDEGLEVEIEDDGRIEIKPHGGSNRGSGSRD